MKVGAYYYPEQWPREQWERDFDNIAAMGLQIVHMAEFAWFSLEPRPGEFHFDWLDRCVELAARRKLDVILCTPTAAPPVWLGQEHPQTLPVDRYGRRERFGGRRHYTPTSPAFQEATRRIVSAMAEHYGSHPAIIGWQLDNEYGAAHDQSEQSHEAFRQWLRGRYGTLENLNRAWGCQFWNTYYTDWSQVLLPASADPGYANPHQAIDGQRFWSWAFAQYNKLQADILRPRIGDRFITTNFMPMHPTCNPADMLGDLSLYSWDSYPVHTAGQRQPPADETFRLGDPAQIGFTHDLMASYTGRWGLMEVQPGQVNWSPAPVLLYPGAVRLWLWTAYAHGAEFITTYRYRQPRFGIELFHHGLVGPDGITHTPGGRQFVQVLDELKRLAATSASASAATAAAAASDTESSPAEAARAAGSAATKPSARRSPRPAPAPSVQPAVGLVFDFDQLWGFASLPQARRWDQRRWVMQWYASLARLGLRIEIHHPWQPIPESLALVVAPALQMVDDDLVARMDAYASRGGHLLMTCRTALMDRNGQLFEGPTAAPILPMIGGSIEAYDGLPEGMWGQVEMDAQQYPWNVWGDLLYAEPTTKVLAKYADQFYAGAAAVVQCRRGEGTVAYCGVFAEQAFTDALVQKLAVAAGLSVAAGPALPPRVRVMRRGRHRIALNYQMTPFEAPAPRGARFIVGSRKVEPAGVAVWEE